MASDIITPLTRVAFVDNGPIRDGTLLYITHIIVEVAKALRGSFKLVTLAPRTVREMTQLLREVFLANHLASNDNLTLSLSLSLSLPVLTAIFQVNLG